MECIFSPPKNQFAMSLVTVLVIKKPLNISSEKLSRIHLFCLQRKKERKKRKTRKQTSHPFTKQKLDGNSRPSSLSVVLQNTSSCPGRFRLPVPRCCDTHRARGPEHRGHPAAGSPSRRIKPCSFLNPDISYFMPLIQDLETSPLMLRDHLGYYIHFNFTWSDITLRFLLLWLATMDLEGRLIKH